MSKLKWDQDGERLYETGVDNVVLYVKKNGAYPKGVAWNGVTGISESPSGGDSNKIYADNIEYLNLISKEEFGASITAYMSPEEFDACDGCAEVAPGVVIGQQTRAEFGLSYRTLIGNDEKDTDYGYKIHIIYGAKASPSQRDHSTVNDSPEATELSWDVTTTPAKILTHTKQDGSEYKPIAHLVIDSTKTDPDKLAAILATLQGTDADPEDPQSVGTDAYLPLPDDLIDMMTPSNGQG